MILLSENRKLIMKVSRTVVQDSFRIWSSFLTILMIAKILESLAGFRTMFLFAVFCKIGVLERNAY